MGTCLYESLPSFERQTYLQMGLDEINGQTNNIPPLLFIAMGMTARAVAHSVGQTAHEPTCRWAHASWSQSANVKAEPNTSFNEESLRENVTPKPHKWLNMLCV